MLLYQELPKLLLQYKESNPENGQLFLEEYCNNDRFSCFSTGSEAIIIYNGCYTKAWAYIKKNSHGVIYNNKHAIITAFLGMTGLNLYMNPRTSQHTVINKIEQACQIANSLGV